MGKFEIFEHVSGDLIKIGESQNRILYDGIAAIQQTMFGVECWVSGAAGYSASSPASGHWQPYRTIAIGTCADDNDGYLDDNGWLASGGSGILADSIPTGGTQFAHFPNLSDSYMTSSQSGSVSNFNVGTGLFFKQADRVVAVGRTISIEATFYTTTNPASINSTTMLTGTEIRELGVYLCAEDYFKSGTLSPQTDRVDRPFTMLCRSVRFQISGGYIQDSPLIAGLNALTVRYTFAGES